MKKIPVSKFRSNMMSFLKDVKIGEEVWLTSHGCVVAKIVPPNEYEKDAENELLEIGRTAVIGDIVSSSTNDWKTSNKLEK